MTYWQVFYVFMLWIILVAYLSDLEELKKFIGDYKGITKRFKRLENLNSVTRYKPILLPEKISNEVPEEYLNNIRYYSRAAAYLNFCTEPCWGFQDTCIIEEILPFRNGASRKIDIYYQGELTGKIELLCLQQHRAITQIQVQIGLQNARHISFHDVEGLAYSVASIAKSQNATENEIADKISRAMLRTVWQVGEGTTAASNSCLFLTFKGSGDVLREFFSRENSRF